MDRGVDVRAPEDEGVLIPLEYRVDLVAHQLAVLVVGKTVGVVVGGQDDHRVVQLARLLQLAHETAEGQLQLHLTGQVALGLVPVGQVLDLVPVEVGHDVFLPGVVQVAADGEAVDHEVVLLHKLGHDLLHHHPVGGGEVPPPVQIPGGDHILPVQPLAHGPVVVAHVGVGFVPVVIGIEIVVVGQGGVPLLAKLVAQGEGHIVF